MICEFLNALIVFRRVEEDEERKTFFRQLLGILERDLTDQRRALVRGPNTNLVVAETETGIILEKKIKAPEWYLKAWIQTNSLEQISLERFVILVRPGLVGSEGDEGLAHGMHLLDNLDGEKKEGRK